MRFYLTLLILFGLCIPTLANNVFVGNEAYEGSVYGTASDVRFVLLELAEALGTEAVEGDDGWTLGGLPVETTIMENKVWINLVELPEELIRVVRSEEMNMIDLFLLDTVEVGEDDGWGNGGTLVFFYADWSEACRAMEQTMAHVAQSRSFQVEFLNIDYPTSDVYRRRVRHFKGDEIPFFLILDSRGRKIDSFPGFFTYAELLEKLKASFSKSK
jgi:thiol-disulfide isomerase/thioredoxin